jgi:hypothetical protein
MRIPDAVAAAQSRGDAALRALARYRSPAALMRYDSPHPLARVFR